jgi:hypothetical protein
MYNYNDSFKILKFRVLNLLLGLYRQRNKLVIRFILQRWYVQYIQEKKKRWTGFETAIT